MKTKPIYSSWSNCFYLLKDMLREHRALFMLLCIQVICGVMNPFLVVYLPKYAIESVTNPTGLSFMKLISFTIVLGIVGIVNGGCQSSGNARTSYMVLGYQRKLYFRSITCDYHIIESEKGHDLYQKAYEGLRGNNIAQMISAMVVIMTLILNFCIYSVLISRFSILLVFFIIILSVIDTYSMKFARDYDFKNRHKYIQYEKQANYLQSVSTNIQSGKDIRIFNMVSFFGDIWDQTIEGFRKALWKLQRFHAMSDVIKNTTGVIRDGLAYGFLIYEFSKNNISLSDFVLYFGIITRFSYLLWNMAYFVNRIQMGSISIHALREFMALKDDKCSKESHQAGTIQMPVTIEFKNVCFSYKDDYVIRNLNLKIKPNEKLAIVGANGAGKTTIVKLLCGLYRPSSGEIYINNIPASKMDCEELASLYSVVFQDVTIFPFSVAENISLKNLEETDVNKVLECLRKTELLHKIQDLKQGIHSPMTRALHENGISLSGGESQKLLMARALYKPAPILILDEPTAALDPIAESETYEYFHSISRDKTTLYISHRMSSTQFCDRIILLHGGTIAESGTHQELMDLKGLYYEMFEIQSHYYKEDQI